MERQLFAMTLESTGGNRARAAELLGVSLRTVRNKVREFGLPPRDNYRNDWLMQISKTRIFPQRSRNNDLLNNDLPNPQPTRSSHVHDRSTPLMRGLERVLDLSAFRHQIIATNLANVDTPGYHTRDVREFAGEIQQAMAGVDEPSLAGQSLTGQSLTGPSFATPAFTPVAHEIRGLLERPDGNNVSVERESLLLAQNQLRFQVAVQFLKAEFHRLSSAINGGSTS